MNYPEVLLPKISYRIIQWSEDLLSCTLIRTVTDNNFYDFDNLEVKVEYIVTNTDHLKDYSTNLLGIFKEEHCKIQLIGERKNTYFGDLWKCPEEVEVPLLDQDFTTKEAYFFYIDIEDVQDKLVEYTFDGKSGYKGFCKVVHTPTKSNFWHFSLRWFNSNGQDVSLTKEHRRAVLSHAKNIIKVCGQPRMDSYSQLREEHYLAI